MTVAARTDIDAGADAVRTAGASLTRSFPGTPEHVGVARAWAAEQVPAEIADHAKQAASELSFNAVLHTQSGEPGGTFAVTVTTELDRVRIAVKDQGTAGLEGGSRWNSPDRIGGWGMSLVEAVASVSILGGVDGGPTTACAEITYPEPGNGR